MSSLEHGFTDEDALEQEEQSFRITPKGWLYVRLGLPKDFDAVWEELTEFVGKQAKDNGCEGIPCLVLDDGGICITAEKSKEDE